MDAISRVVARDWDQRSRVKKGFGIGITVLGIRITVLGIGIIDYGIGIDRKFRDHKISMIIVVRRYLIFKLP